MSIHSSLRSGGVNKRHRSVVKRYERIKILKDKSLWSDGQSVLGIPKVKMQKLKIKKEKTVKADAVAGAPAAAPAAKTTDAKADKK